MNWMTPPLVEFRSVSVCYPSGGRRQLRVSPWRRRLRNPPGQIKWSLKDVTFSAWTGQILGVVGSNGAGKSTLCRTLAGILEPDGGSLTVRAQVCSLLTLSTGLQVDLTGRENLYRAGAFLGLRRKQLARHIPEILDFAELHDAIDCPVRTYSAGMCARLQFSLATSVQPEILLLDEILSVGDLAFREKSRRRMLELLRRSKLVIVVSHDLNFLRSTCTHGIWLDQGVVRHTGALEQVLAEYEPFEARRNQNRTEMPLPDPERLQPH
jgi:ABC-type polysaccharide/polyol phosphate transport system ATPase subunit